MVSIGIGSTLIILYNQESPRLISKDQALEEALKFAGWNKTQITNDTAMMLLQINERGIALILDPKTKSVQTAVPESLGSIGEYLWEVQIIKKLDEYHSSDWLFYIDGSNGTIIWSNHEDFDIRNIVSQTQRN